MKITKNNSSESKRAQASEGPLELVLAIIGPFEYSAHTAKIHFRPKIIRPFQILPK
jgi:hypothetical protein